MNIRVGSEDYAKYEGRAMIFYFLLIVGFLNNPCRSLFEIVTAHGKMELSRNFLLNLKYWDMGLMRFSGHSMVWPNRNVLMCLNGRTEFVRTFTMETAKE